ncbi:MAG: hypothetical protein R3C01_15490 [Planctomycetaceae bacterium]
MARDLFIGITDQSKSSIHRRDDANALLIAERWRGAMYLAGYSIECQLKANLMRMFDCCNLWELEQELLRRNLLKSRGTIFSHQLEELLRLTNTMNRLRQNSIMWPLFNIVNSWIPAWRYNPNLSNREDAEDYLNAVDKVRHWIENNV